MLKQVRSLSGRLVNRFVFAAVIVNLVLVSLFYLAIVNAMIANIKDEFVFTARVKSDLIARLLPDQANATDAKAALKDIMLAGEVVYAAFGREPLLSLDLPVEATPAFDEDFYFGQHGDSIYFISVPISGLPATDTLRLGFSEQGISEQIHRLYRNGLYLSVLYLLLLIPLSVLAARSVSRPIQALRTSAHAVADGKVDARIEQNTGILELQRLGADLEIMRANLVARESRYAAVLANAAEGILTLDQNGHILTVNHSAETILAAPANDLTGQTLAAAFGLEDHSFTDSAGDFHLENRRTLTIPPGGREEQPRHLSMAASAFQQDGHTVHVLLIQDITRHQALQDRLRYMAYHDLLTELPNRQQFLERLHESIDRSAPRQSCLAVLFLDLDHFKVINDSLGHQYGDLLLQEAGSRLIEQVRETDIVARMGGDEFTVLLSAIEQREDAARVAKKIIRAFADPFDLKHYEHYVGVSVGIALYPEDGGRADDLVKQADTAMYQAKAAGRNRYRYYSEAMQRSAIRRLSMANSLHGALKRQELSVHYQPIVDVCDGHLIGAEALARWQHAEHGWISPGEFIPVAEETGIITDLGIWVLERVVADAAELPVEASRLRLSVNISAHQLYHRTFFRVLNTIAAEHPWIVEHLLLEITESAAMVDVEGASRRLTRLKDMGFGIALDDFGTGHSSLSYLRRLPVDVLKIDRSFISEMTESAHGAGIVRNILSLAASLQLKTVAEGVEQEKQLNMLRDIDCDAVQGFLFSPAVPFEAFKTLVAAGPSIRPGGSADYKPNADA